MTFVPLPERRRVAENAEIFFGWLKEIDGSPFFAVDDKVMPSSAGIPDFAVDCEEFEEDEEDEEDDPQAAKDPASARLAKTARALLMMFRCVCFLFIEPMVARRLVKIGNYGQAADSFSTYRRSLSSRGGSAFGAVVATVTSRSGRST